MEKTNTRAEAIVKVGQMRNVRWRVCINVEIDEQEFRKKYVVLAPTKEIARAVGMTKFFSDSLHVAALYFDDGDQDTLFSLSADLLS